MIYYYMIQEISKHDVTFFKRHGWYSPDIQLPEHLMLDARKAVKKFAKGRVDTPLKKSISYDINCYEENKPLINNEFVTLQMQAFKNLAFQPQILSIAAQLLGSNSIRLFADSLITKQPNTKDNQGNVGWHTDKAYWPTCSTNQLLTVWIPLQDVTIEMGPLCILDQSNTWQNDDEIKALFGFGKQDLSDLEKLLNKRSITPVKKRMTLKAGQISFHHCETIHCSEPNTSNTHRVALAVHLQGDKNNYRKAYNNKGEPIIIGYDRICEQDENGLPNYSDPYLFPLLWENERKNENKN